MQPVIQCLIIKMKGDVDFMKKQKSAPYPRQDFDTALDVITQLTQNFPENTIPYSKIVNFLQVKNTASAKFARNISAANQFGLITINNSIVQINKLLFQIIQADTDSEKQSLKLQSFLNSPFNARLCNQFHSKKLPSPAELATLLYKHYGILPTVSTNAAHIFLVSVDQLKLVKNGFLVMYNTQSKLTLEGEPMSKKQITYPSATTHVIVNTNNSQGLNMSLDLDDATATICLPTKSKFFDYELFKSTLIANMDVQYNK